MDQGLLIISIARWLSKSRILAPKAVWGRRRVSWAGRCWVLWRGRFAEIITRSLINGQLDVIICNASLWVGRRYLYRGYLQRTAGYQKSHDWEHGELLGARFPRHVPSSLSATAGTKDAATKVRESLALGKSSNDCPPSQLRMSLWSKSHGSSGRPLSDRCRRCRHFPTVCYFGSPGIPFPSAGQYQTIQFRPDVSAAPCHTCLHIYSDDADIQQLWNNNSTPTLPLKISYAAPSLHSKPTPIPSPTTRKATTAPASSFSSRFVAPSHGASTLAASSMWYQILLRYLPNSKARRAYGLSNAPVETHGFRWYTNLERYIMASSSHDDVFAYTD